MKKLSSRLFILQLGLWPLACSSGSEDATTKMINGTPVPAGRFGSTLVYLLPNAQNKADPDKRCTAVKVSSRHIVTAAHCLVEETGLLDSNIHEGVSKLELSNFGERDTTDTSLWHSGYIKHVRTSPDYEYAVGLCASNALDQGIPIQCKDRWDMPAELAIVEFSADLPAQWPLAQLDLNPLNVGETVSLVGYGKQESRFGRETKARKKYSDEVVRDWDEMKPFINEENVDSIVAGMKELTFVTRSIMNPNADIGTTAGLMPGDSGGPVFRPGTHHVVGIHRAAFFDSNNLPVFHLHSRLNSSHPTVQEATANFLRKHLPASSFVP